MIRSRLSALVLALAASAVCVALTAAPSFAALPEFENSRAKVQAATGTGGMTFKAPFGTWAYSGGHFAGEVPIGKGKTLPGASFKFTQGSSGGCTKGSGTELTLELAGLVGKLGYINKTKKEVGVRFAPTKQPMGTCRYSVAEWEILGGVVARISPLNEETKHFKLEFSAEGTKQVPVFLEGEAEKFPETFPLTLGTLHCVIFLEKETCKLEEPHSLAMSGTVEFETPQAVTVKG